jgi:nucleoside-diphosphate-sugar epimerase
MKCQHLIYVGTVSALPENVRGNSYGLSKRHGEENLELACAELGIDLTILSVTQIYDDLGEARKHQPGFYRIIDCAREGRPFQFFGDKDPLRNLLFVEDLVSVIERVMECRVTGSYAVVHPVSHRFSEIVAMAFEVFGRTACIVRCPDKPAIPSIWYPTDTALYDLIGYWPETDLRTGIAMIRDRMQ